MTPALYEVRIEHVRSEPLRNAFGYGGYLWLVDVDALPVLPVALRALAQFRARDHVGDPRRTIRQNIDAFLAVHDVDLRGGRVLMLTQARLLGHVFNPLSVFWCYDEADALSVVLAEVHNTYGDRHCYLLRPGVDGVAETEKKLYVSPFYPVQGRYRISVPEPGAHLAVAITLQRDEHRPFVATVRGDRISATAPALLRLAWRHPLAPLIGSARIRRQGVGLWLRGLRAQPRPPHHQEGVS